MGLAPGRDETASFMPTSFPKFGNWGSEKSPNEVAEKSPDGTSAARTRRCMLRLLLAVATAAPSFIRRAPCVGVQRRTIAMAGFRNPHNLPTKTCVVCGRPFTWRKKWEKDWEEITTCSKRCKSERKANRRSGRDDDADAVPPASVDVERATPWRRKGGRRSPRMSEAASPIVEAMAMTSLDIGPIEKADLALALLSVPGTRDETSEADEDVIAEVSSASSAESASDGSADPDPRAVRKAAKKAAKLERRARRQGAIAGAGRKPCDLCAREVDLLVRCRTDGTATWRMVCGVCWKTPEVAGGVVDGDGQNPHYRYGGLWKNLAKR